MTRPLEGIRVLEFTHTIMGPCAGMVLADLGADVIKVEPAPDGDHTRRLPGFAGGFFPFFNRNKRSVAIDLKRPEGQALARKLAATADVAIENFGPGTMERLGVGYDELAKANPRLVYLALKGFLSGPYENRPALDEVVQFMSGLAYMTGPPGRPLRAGSSVVDIMGGSYGVIGVLAALRERDRTGRGQKVKAALFESSVLLMGQHMAGEAVTGEPMPPMTARRGAWAVYEPFGTSDGSQVFIGITSDNHWRRFAHAFARPDLLEDERLASNSSRVAARPWLLPLVAEIVKPYTKAQLLEILERESIPFAPVAKTEDLFDDPHLNTGGKLVDAELANGAVTKLPVLPVELDGEVMGLYRQAPKLGEHTGEVLREAGLGERDIAALADQEVIAGAV
jgi:crotonobetainyl-CoA:carnitine CoA-transferase CaiB-like acyl-CoA transferase